jgi:hypothetical protein
MPERFQEVLRRLRVRASAEQGDGLARYRLVIIFALAIAAWVVFLLVSMGVGTTIPMLMRLMQGG